MRVRGGYAGCSMVQVATGVTPGPPAPFARPHACRGRPAPQHTQSRPAAPAPARWRQSAAAPAAGQQAGRWPHSRQMIPVQAVDRYVTSLPHCRHVHSQGPVYSAAGCKLRSARHPCVIALLTRVADGKCIFLYLPCNVSLHPPTHPPTHPPERGSAWESRPQCRGSPARRPAWGAQGTGRQVMRSSSSTTWGCGWRCHPICDQSNYLQPSYPLT